MTDMIDPLASKESSHDLLARLNDTYRLLEANGSKLATVEGELASRLDEIVQFYEHAPVGIAMLDRAGRHVRVNGRFERMTGVDGDALHGRTAEDMLPGIGAVVTNIALNVASGHGSVRRQQVIGNVPASQAEMRVFEFDCFPISSGDAVTGVGLIIEDVTERVLREEQTRQVLHELQHRVKNSLANVMALVEQARRSDGSKELVLDTLRERMRALSRIHSLLTESNWSSIPLADLIGSELGQFAASRTSMTGPDVILGAQPALALATAIHELASNAARFGGLAGDVGGRVDVDWRLEDERLLLRWRETGTAVGQEPSGLAQMGFGSRLIMASIQNTLRGQLSRTTTDNGIDYLIDLPMAALAPRRQAFHLGKSLLHDNR